MGCDSKGAPRALCQAAETAYVVLLHVCCVPLAIIVGDLTCSRRCAGTPRTGGPVEEERAMAAASAARRKKGDEQDTVVSRDAALGAASDSDDDRPAPAHIVRVSARPAPRLPPPFSRSLVTRVATSVASRARLRRCHPHEVSCNSSCRS